MFRLLFIFLTPLHTLGEFRFAPLLIYILGIVNFGYSRLWIKYKLLVLLIILYVLFAFLINLDLLSFLRVVIFFMSFIGAIGWWGYRYKEISPYSLLFFLYLVMFLEFIFIKYLDLDFSFAIINKYGLFIYHEPSFVSLFTILSYITLTRFYNQKNRDIFIQNGLFLLYFIIIDSSIGLLFFSSVSFVVYLPKFIDKWLPVIAILFVTFALVFAHYFHYEIVKYATSESFRILTGLTSIYNLKNNFLGSGTLYIQKLFDISTIYSGAWNAEYIIEWKTLSPQAPIFCLILYFGVAALPFIIFIYKEFMSRYSFLLDCSQNLRARVYFIGIIIVSLVQSHFAGGLLPLILYSVISSNDSNHTSA